MTTLLLASPARLGTLRAAGVEPLVLVSHTDETAAATRYRVTDAPDLAPVLTHGSASFLEVTPRPQVEHPVTEVELRLAALKGGGV